MTLASAIFAMGCFWCGEEALEPIPGVKSVVSGYSGGWVANPTYRQVTRENTGHLEVVKVEYDESELPYASLLEFFWGNVDPLDARGQFCDKGSSYLSAIFCAPAQCAAARASLAQLKAANPAWSVATTVRELAPFYPAEDYHQDYYKKNPNSYSYYKSRCGRTDRLKEVWGAANYSFTHRFNTFDADPVDPYLWLKVGLPVVGGIILLCALGSCVCAKKRRRQQNDGAVAPPAAVVEEAAG